MPSPYRLGLLLCDQERAQLTARFYGFREMFERAFNVHAPSLRWQIYDATRGDLPAVAACDGYLISGSRHSAYESLPWIAALADFVRALADAARPTVGLCFGHQVMAQALGGQVSRAPQGWGLGVCDYETVEATDWMTPPLPRFSVPVCHQDQVTALPTGARRLASSAHCANFVVEFTPRLLGLQAHPEVEPAFLEAIIDLRADSLPPELCARARRSLLRPHDSEALKRWILTFLGAPLAPLTPA